MVAMRPARLSIRHGVIVVALGLSSVGCIGILHVDLANNSGGPIEVVIPRLETPRISNGSTASFDYPLELVLRDGSDHRWHYSLPQGLARDVSPIFVMRRGTYGRLVRLEVGSDRALRVLVPEVGSTRVSAPQPGGFPVRPNEGR